MRQSTYIFLKNAFSNGQESMEPSVFTSFMKKQTDREESLDRESDGKQSELSAAGCTTMSLIRNKRLGSKQGSRGGLKANHNILTQNTNATSRMSGDIQGLLNDFQRETRAFKGDFKMKTSNLASRGSLSISKAAAEMQN